jgi:hypothetical protein
MDAKTLSRELRLGTGPHLARRRWVVGLSALSATMGQLVTLYQTGVLRHLPDPPVGPFATDRVDAAPYAYARLRSPDGPIMVLSYALTAWLAAAGEPERPRTLPLLPLALAAKTLGDALTALELAREEWRDERALCAYCQVATLASLASVALALPEARSALATLRGGGEPARRLRRRR